MAVSQVKHKIKKQDKKLLVLLNDYHIFQVCLGCHYLKKHCIN